MKKFKTLYIKLYAIITPISIFLGLAVNRRVEIDIPLLPFFLGPLLLSAIIAFSYLVYKKTIGNGAWNVLLAFLVAFPVPFILRWMYKAYIFDRPLVIYIFALIYAVLYSFVVLYASLRNKKDEQKLNELLNKKDEKSVE